jgi:hypothetical protein
MSQNIVKLGYRPGDVIAALGSKKLYLDCLSAGWLKPIVDQHKLRLFRQEDVLECYKRIAAGEMPLKTEAA